MSQSVRGRRWVMRTVPPHDVAGAQYPPVIGRLLAVRGVRSWAEARHFFAFETAAASDPLELAGMERAVERILAAVEAEETIAVYGDYDVDGVTATAIVAEGIRDLGGNAITHIPDRFAEGYGLTRAGLSMVRDRGARLVITVDCGVTANPEIEYAAEIGLDVVVLDHHAPPAVLPEAVAIVDPKLGGGPPEYDGLASCGLAFTLLRALYDRAGRSLDEERYLDLAVLGTVADMVPLVGENRRLVRDGLKALRRSRRPGIHALMQTAGVEPDRADAEGISFRLAPRLNAAGRLDHAALALELLTTRDEARATALAARLHDLNARRQRMTEEALTLARRLARDECAGSSLIMVGHEGIPQGIAGLVAGKLAEESYRPAIVYERGDEVSRGSVRSIRELDVVRCLAHGRDLLERWGGHAQAGGFTARTDHLDRLKAMLCAWTDEQLAGFELQPTFEADAELPLSQLKGHEIKWLQYFEPCGQENPTPVFLSRRVPVMKTKTMGGDGRHLRMTLRDGIATWDAVAFDMAHAAPRPGTRVDVLYSLSQSRHGRMELRLLDFATAN